jgi:hypothetical protein
MYVPTHQLPVSIMYPTCTSTKIPHQFHHPNMICNSVIDLVYMITYRRKHHQKNLSFLELRPSFLHFPHKFGLDILWLPQTPIGIQYAQVCLK